MTPDLTAVICTYNRPDLLRRALAAVDAQTHPGTIETIVVFDKSEPDTTLERDSAIVSSARSATSAHPGFRALATRVSKRPLLPVIALCDDDDAWAPEKTAATAGGSRRAPRDRRRLHAACAR